VSNGSRFAVVVKPHSFELWPLDLYWHGTIVILSNHLMVEMKTVLYFTALHIRVNLVWMSYPPLNTFLALGSSKEKLFILNSYLSLENLRDKENNITD